MPGITFTSYIPTSLIGNNSPSPTLAAEAVTGLPIPTGAFPGALFYLNEQQASQLSQSVVNGATPTFVCHAGWYMVVQVDAGATAANIKAGAIGAQKAIPTTFAASQASVPPQAVVTDGATAATNKTLGVNPVIFLNTVTPGNYTIVQVQGDAHVLLAASETVAAGDLLLSQSPGTVIDPTQSGNPTFVQATEVVGVAEETWNSPAGALTLTSVAASSGGSAVYTGTITGGTTPNYVGNRFVITGFTNPQNNGTFLCTACSTTTLTLSNPNAVAETHAGTATALNLMRTNVKFPFGLI
jgi:hypothetical protein